MKKRIILAVVDLLCRLHLLKPIQVARLKYYYKFHRWPDFEHPTDLNEKINWLKFYGDTSRWSDLSDKYKVREYIKEKGLDNILVKLYGKWDKAEEIDWESLPAQFVMKANNGCGDVIICRDKDSLDRERIVKQLDKLITHKYGDVTGEPHYAAIKPCIIAEELLDIRKQPIDTTSLIDYKIWCLNGKPELVWCAWNRTMLSTDSGIYDTDWNYHPEYSIFTRHYPEGKVRLPRPKQFDEMLAIAEKLSDGFPILRVDLYEVDGKVYFGELTFTSLGGFMDYITQEQLLLMGEKVKLH